MTFPYLGQPITLSADAPPTLTSATAHQLKRFAQTHSISALFHITPIPAQPNLPTRPSPSPPSSVAIILDRYTSIFTEPTQLPPARNIQHHIHLLPNTTPVNVRPYRYPHFQKTEIETQISFMLASGLIQPSHSPFSSPILLVKKKGWFVALLCRLSSFELHYYQRPFSHAHHRRIAG